MSNLIEYIEEMFLSVINKKKVDFLNGLTVIAKKPQKRSKSPHLPYMLYN